MVAMTQADKETLLLKICAMFRPSERDPATDVICGPNDRVLIGFDTYFPKAEIIEDYGFTEQEADWFVETVKAMDALRP
ncbi:MAG: hypothetical protein KGL39_50920 [Patescibacteria group bacterium]|nr:hypothetical protein [Patescibacteria group bacterium]